MEAILTERGLGPAVERLAQRLPVPVQLRVDLATRLPAEVETTTYFVAGEALTNVMKHARTTHVTLTLRHDTDTLTVEVIDDGVGGASATAGTGLTRRCHSSSARDGWRSIHARAATAALSSARCC